MKITVLSLSAALVLSFAFTSVNAQSIDTAKALLVQCSSGELAGSTLKDAAAPKNGSLVWRSARCTLEQYDRVEITLTGVKGNFTPKSFALALRADNKYHFAPYLLKPVFNGDEIKLVFNIAKTHRNNVVAMRFYFNRTGDSGKFTFTVKSLNIISLQELNEKGLLAEIDRAYLISCPKDSTINNGKITTVPTAAASVMIPLIKSPAGFDTVRINLTAGEPFSARSFALAMRRAVNKYDFCGFAAKPVFKDGRIELVFNVSKLKNNDYTMLRLYINRNKKITSGVELKIDSIVFEKTPVSR